MGRVRKDYEWCVEYTDKYGDIQDHQHSSKIDKCFIESASDYNFYEGCKPVVVLILSEWTESDGVIDRYWAYPDQYGMPEYFADSYKHVIKGCPVPKRFLNEYTGKMIE